MLPPKEYTHSVTEMSSIPMVKLSSCVLVSRSVFVQLLFPQVKNRYHFRFRRWHETLDGTTQAEQDKLLVEAKRDNLAFAAKSNFSER